MTASLDPYFIKPSRRDTTLFAAAQICGKKVLQEDFFINSNDECIAVSDGVGTLPHGDVASRLACETAMWGYKQIKPLDTYRNDRKELLKRIFRSTNIAVWQKQREAEYKDGMAATLTVVMVGSHNVWIGALGDTAAYFWHEGVITKITSDDGDSGGFLTKSIGRERYGVIPQVYTYDFAPGDMVVLATDGLARFVSEREMVTIVSQCGSNAQSMADAVALLLQAGEKNGSEDNMTACILKRIRS